MKISTAYSTASSPEGARDFLVPSLCMTERFNALPRKRHSNFKQLFDDFRALTATSDCKTLVSVMKDPRETVLPGEIFYQLESGNEFL